VDGEWMKKEESRFGGKRLDLASAKLDPSDCEDAFLDTLLVDLSIHSRINFTSTSM